MPARLAEFPVWCYGWYQNCKVYGMNAPIPGTVKSRRRITEVMIRSAGPKYRNVTRLLRALVGPISVGHIVVDSRWRDNEEAFGLHMADEPALAAFVHTYGQPRECFAIDLGFPDLSAVQSAGMASLCEVLEFDQALALLHTHFDLSAYV